MASAPPTWHTTVYVATTRTSAAFMASVIAVAFLLQPDLQTMTQQFFYFILFFLGVDVESIHWHSYWWIWRTTKTFSTWYMRVIGIIIVQNCARASRTPLNVFTSAELWPLATELEGTRDGERLVSYLWECLCNHLINSRVVWTFINCVHWFVLCITGDLKYRFVKIQLARLLGSNIVHLQ